MNIVVLHGPNLNLLGERPGDEPGLTLEKLNVLIRAKATALDAHLRIYQSNHEGALVDHLHNERKWADAFIVNPGALTHSSYVLRDAISAVQRPVIEVHLTDLNKREPFRKQTVLADVVRARVMGKGAQGYMEALEQLTSDEKVLTLSAPPETLRVPANASSSKKTLGKKVSGPVTQKNVAVAKSLGRAAQGGQKVSAAGTLTRTLLRQKIAERLSGQLTPSALSTWARSHWAEMQGGAATESGQRELIEDTLQQLMLSAQPTARLSDDQLVELMTQLE